MRLRKLCIPAVVVLALVSEGCSRTSPTETRADDPASVEHVAGSDVARVTLSSDAARRLDIQTVPVRAVGRDAKGELLIPYAAVLYDPKGATWAYTESAPLVFERASISVEGIDGDSALLSAGPPPGTDVVTVGAAELLGTEYEVGEE
jgi:hypothetical protein